MTWIIEEPVIWVSAKGEEVEGKIAIGMPEMVDDSARCVLELIGYRTPRPIWGATPLQALTLALYHLGTELQFCFATGGRVLHPGTRDDYGASLHMLFLRGTSSPP